MESNHLPRLFGVAAGFDPYTRSSQLRMFPLHYNHHYSFNLNLWCSLLWQLAQRTIHFLTSAFNRSLLYVHKADGVNSFVVGSTWCNSSTTQSFSPQCWQPQKLLYLLRKFLFFDFTLSLTAFIAAFLSGDL